MATYSEQKMDDIVDSKETNDDAVLSIMKINNKGWNLDYFRD